MGWFASEGPRTLFERAAVPLEGVDEEVGSAPLAPPLEA